MPCQSTKSARNILTQKTNVKEFSAQFISFCPYRFLQNDNAYSLYAYDIYHLLQLSSGIVGEIGESKDEFYIWTHKKLDIAYNGDQIVDVSLTSESKAKLVPNSKLSFTYEVNNLNEFSYSDCKLNLEITLLLN